MVMCMVMLIVMSSFFVFVVSISMSLLSVVLKCVFLGYKVEVLMLLFVFFFCLGSVMMVKKGVLVVGGKVMVFVLELVVVKFKSKVENFVSCWLFLVV